jgi:hypothetical protein
MKLIQRSSSKHQGPAGDRRILINGLTLVALGLSVLFLNSWDNLFVRTSVGLFWGTFFLILNRSGLIQTIRGLREKNAIQHRSSFGSST